MTEFSPNFADAIIDYQALSPVDIEQRYGLPNGNIFQGEITPDQLFSLRPTPECARYRTPIEGLYLCGSATHPGGGVMGAPGHNAFDADQLPIDLRFSAQASFGDYSMPIMKWIGKDKLNRPGNPLPIAEAFVTVLRSMQIPGIAEITATRPGFVNFRLHRPFM